MVPPEFPCGGATGGVLPDPPGLLYPPPLPPPPEPPSPPLVGGPAGPPPNPPPADVIVENTEFEPFVPGASIGEPGPVDPPAPTITG